MNQNAAARGTRPGGRNASLLSRIREAGRVRSNRVLCAVLLLAAGSIALVSEAEAQTPVAGVVDGQVWTVAGSPYVLTGSLQVANLTIEPGVRVEADGDFEIEVTGFINAVGTADQMIVFTATPAAVNWAGMFFNGSSQLSQLAYCQFELSNNSGIRILNSAPPSVAHCTFNDNAGASGGAILVRNDVLMGSVFSVTDCVFSRNTSAGHGGAMQVSLAGGSLSLSECSFDSNIANPSYANGNWVGGAIHIADGDANVSQSTFTANQSNSRCASSFGCGVVGRGGAIYVGTSGSVDLSKCTFDGNVAVASNGGNCFFGGSSLSYGAAIYVQNGDVSCKNSLFSRNSTVRSSCGASDGGSAIWVNGGVVTVVNCTIVDSPNASGIHLAGGSLDVVNSIIYGNDLGGTQVGGAPAINHSDVQNGYAGVGNINENPAFADTLYHLTSASLCIDAGDPSPANFDTSFPPSRGGVRNDMGAYGGPGAWDVTLPLVAVSDVAGDEGGMLDLSWSAFADDSISAADPITSYDVQMGPVGWQSPISSWTTVQTIPAAQLATYSATVMVDTTYVAGLDSVYTATSSWPVRVFRVIGKRASLGTQVSNTNVGMAIDNVPPEIPNVILTDIPDPGAARTIVRLAIQATSDFKESCVFRAARFGDPTIPVYSRDWYLWEEGNSAAACNNSLVMAVWTESHRGLFSYMVRNEDVHGNFSFGDSLVPNIPTGVDLPGRNVVLLQQNAPNPFNPSTQIKFSIPTRDHVSIRVFDLAGRLVKSIVDEEREAGAYGVMWHGKDNGGRSVASGVYVVQLTVGQEQQTRRMALLK